MYDIESIVIAKSVEEAVAALAEDGSALPIAGGSDLLIKIREGKLAGCRLVSIRDIESLKGVTVEADGSVRIGPGTTFAHFARDAVALERLPMLAHAVGQVGGPQIRAAGTIGGNLCNGVTSADSASTLLCMNAALELTGPAGRRAVALADFYKGPGRVDLVHGELLTAIRVARADYEGFGGHYIKYAQRNAMDIATLGCAAYVRLSENKERIDELRLAFGVAAPTPIRTRNAEAAAKGASLCPALFDVVAEAALSEVNPRTSWRASREYRLQLAGELSRRALRQAVANAGGVVHA